MKRTYLFIEVTFIFSFFILITNTMGAPYISFQSIRVGETGIHSGISIIDTNGKNLRHLTNHPSLNC